MKNKIIILTAACSICLLSACSGDRVPQTGQDTIKNRYGAAKDTAKMDTGKATSSDNSASGGAKLMKDTTKK